MNTRKSNSFPSLFLHKFIFSFSANEDIILPAYKGSAFRGTFGWALRSVSCITGKPACDGCPHTKACGYFNIFETEIPTNDIWFLKNVRRVPHPFIIHPPLDSNPVIKKGEIFETGLTLFGSEIEYFPIFVYAFMKMGELGLGQYRRRFSLMNVYAEDMRNKRFHVYTNELKKIEKKHYQRIEVDKIIVTDSEKPVSAKIRFITPARFQKEGKVLANPRSFKIETLLGAIERRYFILSNLFCNTDHSLYPVFSYENNIFISENKLHFHNWQKYSSRQERKVDMGGFLGNLTIKGNLEEVLPLLRTGEHIHVGKNTAFGLGKYVIEYLSGL